MIRSLKFKFLAVLLVTMLVGFSLFFYLAQKVFSDDKRLFVMDLNLNLLKSTTTEIKLDIKNRVEALNVIIPRIYHPASMDVDADQDPFAGFTSTLEDELLSVTFYTYQEGKGYEAGRTFYHKPLLQERNITEENLLERDKKAPLPVKELIDAKPEGILLFNRSFGDVPILTLLVEGGASRSPTAKPTFIVVDLLQDFLRKKLQQSEFAEVFLISKGGGLISHSSTKLLSDYSDKAFPHPIVARMQTKQFPRESLKLTVDQHDYICNFAATSFPDIFAVSQIRESEAFAAIKKLVRQTLISGIFVLSLALVFSVLFASKLTGNIRKLEMAAVEIGSGNLDVKLDIRSNDEIKRVADSFQIMSRKIVSLIAETRQKARMEEELETASLIQSTLLTPPQISQPAVEVMPYYLPATECSGDFWDAFVVNNKLTLVIGDATGHGAPAAIVTAVAKSCFSLLRMLYNRDALPPAHILWFLNNIIYSSCRGKLLMTMSVMQLDLGTGEVILCNAGHESPFRVHVPSSATVPVKARSVETLFARGERMGFEPNIQYKMTRYKLDPNDVVVLVTDGILEAENRGKQKWGELRLRKALSKNARLPVKGICNGIVASLHEFTAGAVQPDDITFVVVKWKGPMAAQAPKKEAA